MANMTVKAKCTGVNTWGMGDGSETNYVLSFGTEKSKIRGSFHYSELVKDGAKPTFEHDKEYSITIGQ